MNGTVNNRVVMNGSSDKTVAVSGDSDKKIVVGGGASVGSILKGDPGADGVTFTPHVDAEGNLSWTNDGNLENPGVVNIKGRDGMDGAAGPKGDKGDKGEPGESGASSWNDLQDKPFGEKQAFEPIIFPNNITELENSTYYDLTPFVGQYLGVNKLYVWRIQTTTPERNIFDGSTASTENHEHGDERTEFFKIDTTVVGINWCDFYEIKHTSGHLTNEISAEWHLYLLAVYDENNFGLPCGVYMSGFINTNSDEWIGLSNILLAAYGKIKISKPVIITIDEKYLPDNIGGATSWNDIEDKPFYSEMVEGDVEFDGDLTGKESFEIDTDIFMAKITENTVTIEQLIGSIMVIKTPDGLDDVTLEITEDMIQAQAANETAGLIAVFVDDVPVIWVTYGDVLAAGAPFSSGTYFMYQPIEDSAFYVHSISCLSGMQEKVYKIDEKYLPDIFATKEEAISIIDVAELPKDNIKNCLYRKYTAVNALYKFDRGHYDRYVDYKVSCVDELPETGIEDYFHLYYNIKDGKIYGFDYDGWNRRSCRAVFDLDYGQGEDCILLTAKLYSYNNGWILLNPVIAPSSGLYSNIFNDAENIASGEYSHAEGANTTASGDASHAEGTSTTASGNHSHAEGSDTTASGSKSHAEGFYTTASGDSSHAEGFYTIASGLTSHAEGDSTEAVGRDQHVQGKYNILDTNSKYAHIVGNGDHFKRSNAHTLDWDGNAWFAGTVEGTAIILKSSTPGSTKRFKLTVDDNGVISATELT